MKWETAKLHIFVLIPLFLLIPFSYHARLLLKGSITTGIVTDLKRITLNDFFADVATYSEITFKANSKTFVCYGPDNYVLPPGSRVKIIYLPEDPTTCSLYNWFVLYMNPFLIITFILELLLFIGYWYLRYELKSKDFSHF